MGGRGGSLLTGVSMRYVGALQGEFRRFSLDLDLVLEVGLALHLDFEKVDERF